jgi:lipopolysaccharide/colanic/teichoic acid biosynthesis glycosyltransferase
LRKSSLDDAAQFINVLKGDMSLVGTRPPTLDEVEKYRNSHYRRISIKPGITGLWQISGRSEINDFDDVVKLDTHYIDNWSMWLDIKIIFKTITAIFNKKGAY